LIRIIEPSLGRKRDEVKQRNDKQLGVSTFIDTTRRHAAACSIHGVLQHTLFSHLRLLSNENERWQPGSKIQVFLEK
jgi:hypothetical protein